MRYRSTTVASRSSSLVPFFQYSARERLGHVAKHRIQFSVAGLVAALTALAACSSSGETPGAHDTALDVPDVPAVAESPDAHPDVNLAVEAGVGPLDRAGVDRSVVPVCDAAAADSNVSQTSPHLVFSPSLGTFAGSRPSINTFYLANPTDVAVGPVRVTVMGPNAADFVATGAACTFGVAFRPTVAGRTTALLSVMSFKPVSAVLSGTGFISFDGGPSDPWIRGRRMRP